ncbi:phage tail sheath protein FI [Bradyrhizobium sp. AZCC 1588]|uniref:phage tail sheath family protein n=1 Tax=unclassified Bradyrhizobium TaxID=2631580 RepID=UPI002FEE9FA4
MPEYLHPGVYIEEIERGPRPIEGVATSTAAFLGETERGPLRPRLITAYNDYLRWFGGVFARDKFMPHAVNGFFDNGGKRVFICRVLDRAGAAVSTIAAGDLTVRALGPGAWGDRVFIQIKESTTKVPDPNNPTNPIPLGVRIQIAYWTMLPPGFTPFNPFDDTDKLPRPARAEDFDDLSLAESSTDFIEKKINGNSTLIEVDLAATPTPNVPTGGLAPLGGGADGNPPAVNDYVGEDTDPLKRIGLAALLLDEFREVSLIYAPGIVDKGTRQKIIGHCENQKFRFAVLDCEKGQPTPADPRTAIQESQYAALYYPWIQIPDPQTGLPRFVPPGGHVLGIYARTDTDRGVFKAPANEVVRGTLDLEYRIDDKIQDSFNPKGINAIRSFPGRGILLWGARTLSSNSLWKYVSVRRLFIFLEASIYEGTQWVVFEPNDEKLWARVKDTIRLFLRGQWRLGAMMGETEDQAFFVTCDRTTMTQDDILNGRLVCEIGIAPVRPAEFVIFRVFQNTVEAQR